MTGTDAIDLKGYPALATLTKDERQQRRGVRIGTLTQLVLQEICEMAHEEADDGVRAILIQGGVSFAQGIRKIIG